MHQMAQQCLTPGYLPKREKNTCPSQEVYTDSDGSLVRNDPKLQTNLYRLVCR